MLDRDLEAPDITRTLRTGYPHNKRTFNDSAYSEIVEVDADEYIKILDERKDDTYE